MLKRKRKTKQFLRRIMNSPPLRYFEGRRIVMEQRLYFQEPGEPRIPILQPEETLPGRWYVVVKFDDGREWAVGCGRMKKEAAEEDYRKIMPGTMLREETGRKVGHSWLPPELR